MYTLLYFLPMLILYKFFLKHIMLPLALAFNSVSARIPEHQLDKIIEKAKAEMDKDNAGEIREAGRSLRDIISLRSILDFSDYQIVNLGHILRNTNSKLVKVLSALAIGAFVITRAFFSLARQRILITLVSQFVAFFALGLLPLAWHAVLNAPLFAIPVPFANALKVSLSLIISSLLIVTFLDIPMLWKMWKANFKKYPKRIAFGKSIKRTAKILTTGTISMMFVGPEIEAALNLSSGVPVLGDTVRFMEEFVYGANGQQGIGTMIVGGIQAEVEERTGVNVHEDMFNYVSERNTLFDSPTYDQSVRFDKIYHDAAELDLSREQRNEFIRLKKLDFAITEELAAENEKDEKDEERIKELENEQAELRARIRRILLELKEKALEENRAKYTSEFSISNNSTA